MSKGAQPKSGADFLVCANPSATKRFEIEERYEVGMVLTGSEAKSLRARKADLEGAYALLEKGELFLHKAHIAPYEQAGVFGHEPKRTRKLLAHRGEIEKIHGRLTMRGYSLVPLKIYFKNGRAKTELGLGRARKMSDNRETLKREQDMKEARAAMSRHKAR